MANILNDLWSGKISKDDIKTLLTSNSSDKADFIHYFLNYVKENCSWLVSKTDKCINLSSYNNNENNQSSNSVVNTSNNYQRNPFPHDKAHFSSQEIKVRTSGRNETSSNDLNVSTDFLSKKSNFISKSRLQNENKKDIIKNDFCKKKFDGFARKNLKFIHANEVKCKDKTDCNKHQMIPDVTSLEAFPPVNVKGHVIPKNNKAKRRITPTPVQEISPGTCKFGTAQFDKHREITVNDCFTPALISETPGIDLKEEREMLKITRKQMSISGSMSSDFNNLKLESTVSPTNPASNLKFIIPDPKAVTYSDKLQSLSEIYSILLSNALVQNITSELYFIFELLTSTVLIGDKSSKKNCIFNTIHNCVFFSVCILSNIKSLIHLLDNCALQALKEIPFLALFSPELTEYLKVCCEETEEILTKSPALNQVPFIVDEDSSENFLDPHAFTNFRKQRDLFYELLREWKKQPFSTSDSRFTDSFARKAKNLINIAPNSVNLHHLAKLFQNQMIASCLGLEVTEIYDDILGNIQKTFPSKVQKLQERFMKPFYVGGPSPAPAFYGTQIFFSELIQAAQSITFNQHLSDMFIAKIIDVNKSDIFADLESNTTLTLRQEYTFLLHTLRLLGKFLGFLHFLPYKVDKPVSSNILEHQLDFRKISLPVIDIFNLLSTALEKGRILLTVPWVVEYISMIDPVGKNLPHIEKTLKLLNSIYLEISFVNMKSCNVWFLRMLIGWVFDSLCYPLDYSFNHVAYNNALFQKNKAIDVMITVNKQIIHSCCPYLVEFKVLVYSFLNGLRKDNKEIRKITPLSTTKLSSVTSTEQQIQLQLEENFFFLHPPSLKKSVTFVAERIASRIIQKIRSDITNFKLQSVELIINHEEYKKILVGSPSNKKKSLFLDSFIFNLYKETECNIDSLIQCQCFKDIKNILPLLLSDDVNISVLKMSCDISFRLAQEKIISWCDANLIFNDIKQDIMNKLNHLSKEVETVSDEDFNLSAVLSNLRRYMLQNLSGKDDMDFDYISLSIEVSSLMHKPISSSNKKLLAFLMIDLYVSALVNANNRCIHDLHKNFISVLSMCPKSFDLENYFISCHNVKLLIAGKDHKSSCQMLNSVIAELITEKVFRIEQIKYSLETLNQYEWKSPKGCFILESLSQMLMKYCYEAQSSLN